MNWVLCTRRTLSVGLMALLTFGCATAQLDDGEYLYTGGSVQISGEEEAIPGRRSLERSVESNLTPQPNTSILGMRPGLWVYGVTEGAEDTVLRGWIRERFGESPVLFDEEIPAQTVPAIEDTLFNRGFFDADVSWDVEHARRTASIHYTVLTRPAWTIRSIDFPDEATDSLTQAIVDSAGGTLIETGVPYRLDTLVSERERIDRFLRERGFFAFNPAYIVFDAELEEQDRSVSLTVTLEAPEEARIAYEIGSIAVYADYSPDQELPSEASAEPAEDIQYFEDHPRFDPEHVLGALLFRPGDLHDRRTHIASLSRLNSMESFRFVNIRYQPDPESGLLHTEVLLTPLAQRSIEGELSAVQRFDGFAGPAFRVGYTDRNLYGGGERLNLGLGASLETRITGGSFRFEGYEIEIDGSIRFPRSVGPLTALGVISPYGRGSQLPRSSMRFALRRQDRFEGERVEEASTGISYEWPGAVSQEWRPVELTVIRRGRDEGVNELLLESVWRADTSDTIASTDLRYRLAADAVVGTEIFASRTFFRLDTDSRLFVPVIAESLLALRTRIGAGRAGGADSRLPDARRFIVGGSTGLRGFAPASFGPGTISPEDADDPSGDIRFESSVEYRFGIAGWVNGAVFADAGNTWKATGPERLRRAGQLFSESAVNLGAGLRVDPGILVVRVDLGVPLRRPWRDTGDRWITDGWDIGNPDWRRENLIINLAIGYPF